MKVLSKLNKKIILILIFTFLLIIFWQYFGKTSDLESIEVQSTVGKISTGVDVENIKINTLESYEKNIPLNMHINLENLPNFITIENNKLVITPQKYDMGSYPISMESKQFGFQVTLLIQITPKEIDLDNLESQINEIIGDEKDHYGIYLYDFFRDKYIKINETKEFPPASLSKLPDVILTLKDIDSGKYSFESLVMVSDSLKHSFEDSIGFYPAGTYLPLQEFISNAILESNNTAHYHLHELLGGTDVVDQRTKDELNAQIFLSPHIATAEGVFTLLSGIYSGRFLKSETNDYLLDLMENTYDSLRIGIPAGITDSDVKVADKVGFLFGGIEGDTFSDAAIVYGRKTDYALVILNDKALPFPDGSLIIEDISRVVYDYLNN